MSCTRHTTEQIIHKLQQAEVEIAKGKLAQEACRVIGVTEQTFYRWRRVRLSLSFVPNCLSTRDLRFDAFGGSAIVVGP